MAKNEDGEFELVLGNRQLLSVFFIVVILFGVFFTMGYIVGRNSAPTAAATIPADRGTLPAASANAGERPSALPEPSAKALAPGEAQVVGPGEARKLPASSPPPAAETKVTETRPAEKPPAAPEPKPAPAAPFEVKPASPPVAAPQPGSGQMYLQVAAVAKPDAEILVDTLKKRGLPALIGPGPSDTIFRVLVGPYQDSASAAKSKAELEALGFKPWLRK